MYRRRSIRTPWEVEIEANPKNDAIGVFSGEFTIQATSQASAIAMARKKLARKNEFSLSNYRTRVIYCHEQQA